MIAHRLLVIAALSAVIAIPAFAQSTAPVDSMPSTASAKPATMFPIGSALSSLWSSKDAIGQAVYNKANERLGDVEELLLDRDGKVMAAVVGVGGFLGMGETRVAIAYQSFEMMPDKDGKSRLVVDVNKEALKNAIPFKATDVMKRT